MQGNAFKQCRLALGETISENAKHYGISRSTVKRLEAGKKPSARTTLKIKTVIMQEVHDIFSETRRTLSLEQRMNEVKQIESDAGLSPSVKRVFRMGWLGDANIQAP